MLRRALCVVLIALSAAVHASPAQASTTLVPLAHRANDGVHRESSLAGMEALANAGRPYIELDQQWTADHVAIIWHDPVLPAACTGPAAGLTIAAVTAAQIAATTCSGEAIATLTDVVTLLGAHPALRLWLEPKNGDFPGVLAQLVALGTRVTLEGKLTADLNLSQAGGHGACYIGRGLNDLVGGAAANHWPCVAPVFTDPALTAARITSAAGLGVTIVPWTPNTQADLTRLCQIGVRFVLTDQVTRAASTSC